MFPLSSVIHCLLPKQTVLNRPAAKAEHTLSGDALHPLDLSLIKRMVTESSPTLQIIFNFFFCRCCWLLRSMTVKYYCNRQWATAVTVIKKYCLKNWSLQFCVFFLLLLLAWVVFATYTVHQEKKCLRDMFLFLWVWIKLTQKMSGLVKNSRCVVLTEE